MIRNTAGQKVQLFAFDYSTGAPKTGDAANLTAYVKKDSGTLTVLGDTTATEVSSTNAPGWYEFDLTQAESDAVDLLFTGKSITANVAVVGFRTTTVAVNVTLLAVSSTGGVTLTGGSAPTVADIDTQLSATHGAGSWLTGSFPTVPTVGQIDAQLSSTHGAGSWITAIGFLDAPGTRLALGLTTANLDSQFSALNVSIGSRAAPGDEMSLLPSAYAGFFLDDTGETYSSAVDGSVVKEIADNTDGGGIGTFPTTAEIADKVLGRNIKGGSDGGRTVYQALAGGRNKITDNGDGTFTVYDTDDATPLYTGTLTRSTTVGSITGVDPT